uniref:Uncharacterized protein n=1 Tax=viral metagenome TaxID=1070528 RepID=A0A6M3J484_9ZZZZ
MFYAVKSKRIWENLLADDVPWYFVLLAGIGVGAFIFWLVQNKLPTASSMNVVAANNETWEYLDYRGVPRTIKVTREVKE